VEFFCDPQCTHTHTQTQAQCRPDTLRSHKTVSCEESRRLLFAEHLKQQMKSKLESTAWWAVY